jgi:hypothetical protein
VSDTFSRYQQGKLTSQPEIPLPSQDESLTFQQELASLLNKHSKENLSGTPDFILAMYLSRCLETFDATVRARAEWRGERVDAFLNQRYDKKVPVNVYNGRTPNQIGEAELEIWPGETAFHGVVIGLVPMFAPMPESGFAKPDEA